MLKEFKEFALRGNVIDLAVGVIMGGAFGKIVTSLVNDIIMPPIGMLLGQVNFADLFIDLSRKGYPTLADAKAAGAATINYGMFLNTILDFIIVAFVVFVVIRQMNRMKKPNPAATPADPIIQTCPHCATEIPIKATRCPNCTSQL